MSAMRPCLNPSRAIASALLLATTCVEAAPGDPAPGRIDFLESAAVVGLDQWPIGAVIPSLPALHDNAAARATPRFALHFTRIVVPVDTRQTLELHAAAAGPAVGPPLESADDRVRRLKGFSDVSLGAQWRVRGGDAGWLPGVAWLADVETTTGSPAFRDRNVRPSLRATARWQLPQQLTLGVMQGLYRDRGDGGRHYAAGVLAMTLGKSWTPRLQSFVELAGQALSRSQPDASLLDVDTGLAFVASRTLQVDMVVSRSLSGSASQQLRGGLSVSSRF
jgi:hypothetical protein